jgi:biofilm PGA synthesis N-glycosyltransferase PgaC
VRFVLAGSIGLIAYVLAGYPAAVALLARVRPRRTVVDRGFEPDVTVVVAAYNEAHVIEEKLQNTYTLEYPRERLEVMVVADGSDDETAAIASRVDGTVVLHRPERRGKLAAMNRAAEAARGEILVFSDANNRYTPETLRALASRFADSSVGVVTGRKAIDDGEGRPLDRAEGLYWRYESKIREWETAIGSVTGVAGEILAFRKAAYYSPREGTMNEDFVQAMLAAINGWRVVYAPDAVSLERASATLGDEATRRTRLTTGRWQALRELLPALARRDPQLAWQVVSHKGLRPLIPFAMATAAVSNATLVREHPWARPLAAAQLAFYGAALVGRRDAQRGRRRRWTYLPYYFCRMQGAALTGFHDFAGGRREHVWAKVSRG